MQDRTLTLIEDDGTEILCDILFTYHWEKLNKDYVVFQVRATGEISAASYTSTDETTGSLDRIENEEEWTMLEELLNDYAEENQNACQGCASGCGSCSGCSGCDSCDEE